MVVVAAESLSKKMNSPWPAGLFRLVLIGFGIYGLSQNDMPTFIAIALVVVGVINMLRLLPKPKEVPEGAAATMVVA